MVHVCTCSVYNMKFIYMSINIKIFLLLWLGELPEFLFFGPSFRKPARNASSWEIYLKNEDLYATDR